MSESRRTSYPKNKIKVVLAENIAASAQALFAAEEFQVELVPGALAGEELGRRIADAHVLGIRSKTHVDAEALAKARRLLALGCFCIGTNQVDLATANQRGVPVFNAPFSNTRSVAELIIAEIVVLARQLGDRSREVHAGSWAKTATACHEIRGKTLGIVGYGHIGSQLGVLAEAMGMRVAYYDTATKLPLGNAQTVPSLGELLGMSDFVTLHVPATPQTKNMIGAGEFTQMKKGAHFLNASRGNVVVIPALVEALASGHLGGAAIDVYPEEPEGNGPGFKSPLQGLKNVLLTPHIGGSTVEAQSAIGREVATALIKYINAGTSTGAVNFPQVELAPVPGTHRILNVHQNVPGVLRDINNIIAESNANISSQMLATDAQIGYLVMDVNQEMSDEVHARMSALNTNIKTRLLY